MHMHDESQNDEVFCLCQLRYEASFVRVLEPLNDGSSGCGIAHETIAGVLNPNANVRSHPCGTGVIANLHAQGESSFV